MKFDKITEKEFNCLAGSHTTMKSFFHDPEHQFRFEIISDNFDEDNIPPDNECTMHWYESGVHTVFDLQRFRDQNLLAIALWDLATEEHCIVVHKRFNSSDYVPDHDPN